jgi:DNA polymerase-4
MGAVKRILHIDMDAFFAAIEQHRHPELRGRPVIVGGSGDPQERGVVSTASYEARKFAIHSAMPLRTAFHLCPGGTFLPVDYPVYVRVSKKVKALLSEFSPVMEDVGIDEAYLDISHLKDPDEAVGQRLKERVRKATGLTASVGIGPNKLLAKMASDLQKPDGLTILGAADVPARLGPLPVRRLPGVGPRTEAHLADLGVQTIGELAALSLSDLIGNFGMAHGCWLHQAARGIDHRPLITRWEPKSLGREVTFQRDIFDLGVLARVLTGLAGEVAARLRDEGVRGRTVTVKLRYADFETHTHALTLGQETDRSDELRRAALQCLARFPLHKKVRLIGVRVTALQKKGETPCPPGP